MSCDNSNHALISSGFNSPGASGIANDEWSSTVIFSAAEYTWETVPEVSILHDLALAKKHNDEMWIAIAKNLALTRPKPKPM